LGCGLSTSALSVQPQARTIEKRRHTHRAHTPAIEVFPLRHMMRPQNKARKDWKASSGDRRSNSGEQLVDVFFVVASSFSLRLEDGASCGPDALQPGRGRGFVTIDHLGDPAEVGPIVDDA